MLNLEASLWNGPRVAVHELGRGRYFQVNPAQLNVTLGLHAMRDNEISWKMTNQPIHLKRGRQANWKEVGSGIEQFMRHV